MLPLTPHLAQIPQLAELASELPSEKDDKWAVGAATDLEGEHQSFASLLGAETDEEPEVVEES